MQLIMSYLLFTSHAHNIGEMLLKSYHHSLLTANHR